MKLHPDAQRILDGSSGFVLATIIENESAIALIDANVSPFQMADVALTILDQVAKDVELPSPDAAWKEFLRLRKLGKQSWGGGNGKGG